MRVAVIGSGPAGLYFAIQMKKLDPSSEVTVYERNRRGVTYGWGVVFSAGTLENFRIADEKTYAQITSTFAHWDKIDVHFGGKVITSDGHGFCGIQRHKLLDILATRAEELGVKLLFEKEMDSDQLRGEVDCVVAADSLNSTVRNQYQEQFQPDIDLRQCKFVWLGTEKIFDAFTFLFKETEHGWFQAHCYRFNEELSTVVVECPQNTWQGAGIDQMSKEQGIEFCEELFGEHLKGHRLMSNADHLRGSAIWLNFPRVNCQKWHHENIVLLGDAAATAHFSVGSGTKLAMESAVELAKQLHQEKDVQTAFTNYQELRRLETLRLQNAARNSTEWFEQVGLKAKLEPEQFNYSLITRSQRVSHENLRLRDKAYLEGFERWYAKRATGKDQDKPLPPMFVPFKLRNMQLINRVVCSPMDMYSAIDGTVGDFHLVHLGARALGGAGLVFTEMTCVSQDARISPGCAGLYNDQHTEAWKRIVDFVHKNSKAKIAMQLGHAGRKGSTQLGWQEMDAPLKEGNWPIVAPSAIAWKPENQQPKELTHKEMQQIGDEFVAAALKANEAGFDLIEIHCAHGYLLSSFISPLTNLRSDEYGGSLENRMRYPQEVIQAVRDVWPEEKPLSVRISATDWREGGTTIEDSLEIARMLKECGVDVIDVSTGQVTPDQKPVYGRMYQVPFAERIRLEVGMATMAVGNIYEPDHVNSILAAGRADLCLLARPHLWDAQWTLRAAAELGYEDIEWPKQYESGKQQIERICQRARESQLGPI